MERFWEQRNLRREPRVLHHEGNFAVRPVAAEQLVAAGAGQCDLESALCSRPADEVRVDRIRGRLVHRFDNAVELDQNCSFEMVTVEWSVW